MRKRPRETLIICKTNGNKSFGFAGDDGVIDKAKTLELTGECGLQQVSIGGGPRP